MRHELRRFNLTDRERTLASLILSLSWEEGVSAVRVPKLDFFEHLTGLAANHVSETLHDLTALMRVVVVAEADQGRFYSINHLTETWQAKPRVSRPMMLETLNLLREVNGIPRQTEGQLNFKFQSLTHFLVIKTPVKGAIPSQEAL
jgi:hypothetical protein